MEIMVLYERCQRIFHEQICSGLKVSSTNQLEYLVLLLRQHFSPKSRKRHALYHSTTETICSIKKIKAFLLIRLDKITDSRQSIR